METAILEAAEKITIDDTRDPDGLERHAGPRAQGGQDELATALAKGLQNEKELPPSSLRRHPESAHTGPKGVLADYRYSNKPKKTSTLAFDAIMDRDEQDQLDDGEQQAISSWRRKRMMELQMQQAKMGDAEPRFGHFREIGAQNFERAVLDEDPSVKVVLHLFEAHLPRCLVLNLHLSNLARDFPSVKFLRVQASEVDFSNPDSHDIVLPTILVYQGGELINNLVAVDQAWDRKLEYDEDALTQLLIDENILSAADREAS